MTHALRAIREEYAKLDRPINVADFEPTKPRPMPSKVAR